MIYDHVKNFHALLSSLLSLMMKSHSNNIDDSLNGEKCQGTELE